MTRQIPLQPLPDIDVVGVMESWRHDAGDGVRQAVEAKLPSDDRPVGVIARPPETIADHDERLVGDEEGPPTGNPSPICGRTPRTSNRLPLTSMALTRIGSSPGSVRFRLGRHHAAALFEDRQRAIVHERDRRQLLVLQSPAGTGIPQRHQPIRLRVRKRPQQHGIDDREHHGAGANTEREHQDRDGGEARPETKLSHRKSNRAHEIQTLTRGRRRHER